VFVSRSGMSLEMEYPVSVRKPWSQAIRTGEHLFRAGVEGWRSSPDDPGLLTGLSHAASGVRLALLEHHSATGIERFIAAGCETYAVHGLPLRLG
jgi:lantibiotic modifying enzyme